MGERAYKHTVPFTFFSFFFQVSSDRVMSRLRDAHVAEDTEGHWLIGPVIFSTLSAYADGERRGHAPKSCQK